MEHLFTVGTPTYNRKDLLKRLYISLKNQTFKDFVWLIVDDGSDDGTSDVVSEFISEGVLDIQYEYQDNKGLYYVDKKLYSCINTKYYVGIDDDDALTPDCLEVFKREWEKIELANLDDIGCIRALSIDEEGIVSGDYDEKKDVGTIDSDYIEMDWVRGKHFENITCLKSEVYRNVNLFTDEDKWLFDKIKVIYESVFWNRIARKYKTRYIFTPLRIYYHDATTSLTRNRLNEQKCYNYVVTSYLLLNDLGDERYKNFARLLKVIGQYWSCVIALNLSPVKAFRTLNNSTDRFFSICLMPLAFIVGQKIRIQYHDENKCLKKKK